MKSENWKNRKERSSVITDPFIFMQKAITTASSKSMIINLSRIKKVRFHIHKTPVAIIFTLSLATAQLHGQDFGGVRAPSYLAHRDLERQATAVKIAEIQRESEMLRMQLEIQQLEAEKMRLREDALKRLPAIATQLSEISIEPNIDAAEKFKRAGDLLVKNADIASVPEVSSTFNMFYKLTFNAGTESCDSSENNTDEDVDATISSINNEFQNLKKYVRSLETSISYFDHEENEDSFSDIDDNFRKVKRAFSTLESTVPLVSSETKIINIKNAIDDISSRLKNLRYEVDDFNHEESEDSLSEIEHEFNRLKRAVTNCEFYL
jgi:hypothetical protein